MINIRNYLGEFRTMKYKGKTEASNKKPITDWFMKNRSRVETSGSILIKDTAMMISYT
jgi:hypothetical protein